MMIKIAIDKQQLQLFDNERLLKSYPISTAVKGVGEISGSECTPRGWHVIRAKIGAHCPANTVFIKRRPTGEIYTAELAQEHPQRDWILTRILWLSGLEVGKNRLGNIDTMRRYIYIHGTPDTTKLGIVGSHGCIRMRNTDIIELFDLIQVGTKVLLVE